MGRLLTVAELAEMLNKPAGTVRDWVYKKQVPFLKVGAAIRFDPAEIETWLDAHRQGMKVAP